MSETAPTAPEHERTDLRRYLAARVVSVAGSLVAAVALPVLVYRLTGSPAWTAAIATAEALPYLLFGLFAGALADRVDRRRLMVGVDLACGAVLAGIPLAWWAGVLTPWQVLGTAVAVQTGFVFFDAANFGALPTLVGPDRITAAFSTLYGATTVVELVVPPLAGLAVATLAPAGLLSVTALTAVASALLIRSVAGSLPPGPGTRAPTRILADVREGLALLMGHPVVRTLTLVGTTQAVAGGAWLAMTVPWADRVLGIRADGDARLGLLFACWGVGGLAAARLVPRLSERWGGARLALAGLPVSLACAVAVVSATHWVPALLAATAFGAAYSTVVLNAVTYRLQVTPAHARARVSTTARMLSWGLGTPAGAALAGVVATTPAGPRGGLAAGAAVLAAGVALAWLTPPLRRAARG
ncbi:MFS transporter [Pseudonocardia alni]|uniref:MFS family arabinose efflux permease n=1 Tax=Pseudonocardia alni TaxID=33907 RepID=A0A852W6Z4_PSEA5|nr:MFS transporter [Pseudonocardia antarctica]NYG04679.1 putative MFS family arabinose efflux permease [Pseudonocardia antarctica]